MADNTEKDFNWKGEHGDKFAELNPSTAEGQDKDMAQFFQATGTEVFTKALNSLKENGFAPLDKAKVLDVGCSSGGKLAILETLGLKASNLFGVDMSPKAVEVALKNHPDFNVKEINGFAYKVFPDQEDFDLVYHSAVFCQIPEDDYEKFFSGIRDLKPKFYMFLEGICPSGPEKIPNSLAHAVHKKHQKEGHHHHHHHGHHDEKKDVMDAMEEGFHYVDNLEAVVSKHLPESKQISKQRIEVHPDKKEMFDVMKIEFFLAAIYKM